MLPYSTSSRTYTPSRVLRSITGINASDRLGFYIVGAKALPLIPVQHGSLCALSMAACAG